MRFLGKRNDAVCRGGFFAALLTASCFLAAGCSEQRHPDPPKAHPELLLEIYDAAAKKDHSLAQRKIERLRSIEKTSVFLPELETAERNNAILTKINEEVATGNFVRAMQLLERQEIAFGKHDDTNAAKEQLQLLIRLDTLLGEACSARSSGELAQTISDIREIKKKIMISQKIQNFVEKKESDIKKMRILEKDRMIFGIASDAGTMLEADIPELYAAAALLALEAGNHHPAVEKLLSELVETRK